jgi:RimJ/RimL family protein N-acetyltransferase
MADLIKPSRQELSFRNKIHESKKTMSFQGYIDSYTEEELDIFMKEVVEGNESKQLYRLVYCDGCADFVSETSWIYDDTLKGYVWNVIVRNDLRRVGYGRESLRLMKEEALRHDIHTFYSYISEDNEIAKKFLLKEGFKKENKVYCLTF